MRDNLFEAPGRQVAAMQWALVSASSLVLSLIYPFQDCLAADSVLGVELGTRETRGIKETG